MNTEVAELNINVNSEVIPIIQDNSNKKLAKMFVENDLSKLNDEEKSAYYMSVCESVGLNPATRPFEFIKLGGRTVLYASKGCSDQLRKINNVSVRIVSQKIDNGLCIVTTEASLPSGRTDTDIGAVPIEKLSGEFLSNAMMKAITKAKRRVTLSICGLGMLDESEIESIPNARPSKPIQVTTDHEPVELETIKGMAREALIERLDETFATFAPSAVEGWISKNFAGKKRFDDLSDFELEVAIERVKSKK